MNHLFTYDIVFAFSFYGAIILFCFFAFTYISNRKISKEVDSDNGIESLADTDIVVYPFRGEWITLTKIEYLNMFKGMNRQERNKIFENQQKKLKQGLLRKVYYEDNGEKRYYLCATEKGKVLSSIHQKKDKIYKEQ